MSSENYPAAKDCFEKAIEVDNKSFDAYTHLGNACANLEQIKRWNLLKRLFRNIVGLTHLTPCCPNIFW